MNKKTIMIIIAIIIILSVLIFIRKVEYRGKENEIKIQIGNEDIVLNEKDETASMEVKMLDNENGIYIKNNSNSVIMVNGKKLRPKKEIVLNNIEINKNNTIDIKSKFLNDQRERTYNIKTLPEEFPDYEANGKSNYEGKYYFNVNYKKESYLVKVNEEGKIVFYKSIPTASHNFRKIEKNGKVRYTYIENTEKESSGDYFFFVVLDENYNEIDRVKYKLKDGTEIGVYHHESLYLDDRHYILIAVDKQQVNDLAPELGKSQSETVQNCLIEEIQNGNVKWEFESINHPELYNYCNIDYLTSLNENNYLKNYTHPNDIKIDPSDNNVVLSFRHLCALIKISRQNGEIMWILGGKGDQFGLTEEQKFIYQHSISFLNDNTIMLYDNSIENSRVLKIKINEKNKTIEKYESFDLDVYSSTHGYIQAIDEENDIYLISYGQGDFRGKNSIEEKNLKTGEVYFSFQLIERNVYDALKFK